MLISSQIQIRDPFIVPFGQRYYLFGSTDQDIWQGTGTGFDVYASDDLENWDGPLPAFRPEPGFYGQRNFWAPEVHRYGDDWYMLASFKSDTICRGTGVLRSRHITGPYQPWSDGSLTPADWECLDGTLHIDDDGVPWLIFCHEWVQIHDGEILAMPLSADLRQAAGRPIPLFRASDAVWTAQIGDETRYGYVTDGPSLYRGQNGILHMLWSSLGPSGYCIGVAHAASGRITGPWQQDPDPLFRQDGGHGMLFRTFAGQLMLTIHQPNQTPLERPVFFPVNEQDGSLVLDPAAACPSSQKIDRQSLVRRHNPVLNAADPASPLSAGNGEMAFTADITGFQTLRETYQLVPLCTMAQWGWHSFAVDAKHAEDLRLQPFDTYGRPVGYASDASGQEALYDWLRENSHRLNLISIGLVGSDDRLLLPSDLSQVRQELDLWTGLLHSRFSVDHKPLYVRTSVHPAEDTIVFHLAALTMPDNLGIQIEFPYGSAAKSGSDWLHPERHQTLPYCVESNHVQLERILDQTRYQVDLCWTGQAALIGPDAAHPHRLIIRPSRETHFLTLVCRLNPPDQGLQRLDPAEAERQTRLYWQKFWQDGAAIQLIHSADPRARELERRIILSQYLTAIQCSGSMPPAETGLTCNSWFGKCHLEMHYWHAAHFALWGRAHLLKRSMAWYRSILPEARRIAADQGYQGARWPKMCDASGQQSPSWIAVFLIWQQPHPIMLAELIYRANPDRAWLAAYRDIVIESADFMVSYAHYDNRQDRYVLGPPVIPAQEVHDPATTVNPPYELAYFRWALSTANQWLARLGEEPRRDYAEVAAKLADLPVADGCFLAAESCPDTFIRMPFPTDHPSMLAPLGILPGDRVDRSIMQRTVEKVLQVWDRSSLWGWDYPMIAMTLMRLGCFESALDVLLSNDGKNTYRPNGHNAQGESPVLPLYLPGNGGLLLAAALLAGGWDGQSGTHPASDLRSWQIESEGFSRYI